MAMAEATPTMFPVPTVAPSAVAVAEKAFLLLKILPKVDFIINPALRMGKNPAAKVRNAPVTRTIKRSAGPHIIFESSSIEKENPCVLYHLSY